MNDSKNGKVNQKKSKYKKKAEKQFLAIGTVTIALTLCCALSLVYLSSKGSIEKSTAANASRNINDITSLNTSSNDSSNSGDNNDSDASNEPPSVKEEKSNTEFAQGEDAKTSQPPKKPDTPAESKTNEPDNSKSTIIEGVDFELTQEEIAKIESIINTTKKKDYPSPEPNSIAVYFEDLGSGYSYKYNENEKYHIASLIKAPYALYLYTLAEQGKCDLAEVITIEYKDVQEGTGDICKKKKEEFPINMTVQQLVSAIIRTSDNTAMEKLRKKYPASGYIEYAKGLGIAYPEDIHEIVNGTITAHDSNIYIKAVYDYIEHGKYGKILQDDMEHTRHPMIRANYPIARKYGWSKLSFHEMAIVYAKSPYVLTICTNRDKGKNSDYELFANLSMAFAEFHQKRYP